MSYQPIAWSLHIMLMHKLLQRKHHQLNPVANSKNPYKGKYSMCQNSKVLTDYYRFLRLLHKILRLTIRGLTTKNPCSQQTSIAQIFLVKANINHRRAIYYDAKANSHCSMNACRASISIKIQFFLKTISFFFGFSLQDAKFAEP